jgi:hypothetical protein
VIVDFPFMMIRRDGMMMSTDPLLSMGAGAPGFSSSSNQPRLLFSWGRPIGEVRGSLDLETWPGTLSAPCSERTPTRL